jgi:hypothetical protein
MDSPGLCFEGSAYAGGFEDPLLEPPPTFTFVFWWNSAKASLSKSVENLTTLGELSRGESGVVAGSEESWPEVVEEAVGRVS